LKHLSSLFPLQILKSLKKLQQGRSSKFNLIKIKTTNGQMRWIKLEALPWIGRHHVIDGIILFCEDITREQKLFLDNQNLHHANEMLQNFSLIFSHDLIQPLRQISNHAYLIEEQLKNLVPTASSLENLLAPIKKCITHARELCEGIVFYCRNGNPTIKTESVCLEEILQAITETCLQNVNVYFKSSISQNVYLLANKTTLLQLFQNLLDNAIKHSQKNTPTITLSVKKLKNGFCKFDLYNNSYYPNSNNYSRIFNAFESSQNNGAGLGLMICKKIVSAYGGIIFMRSSLKKGTIVTFTLPFCDRDDLEDERYQPNKTKSDEFGHKILETKRICE
jgi:signal transduction histidine kinase